MNNAASAVMRSQLYLLILLLLYITQRWIQYYQFTRNLSTNETRSIQVVWSGDPQCAFTVGWWMGYLKTCDQYSVGDLVHIAGVPEETPQILPATLRLKVTSATAVTPAFWYEPVVSALVKARYLTRLWLLQPFKPWISPSQYQLINSLVLGARDVPIELRQGIAAFGVQHAIAVSGSHLTLMVWLADTVLQRLTRGTVRIGLLWLVVMGYVSLVGFQAAVVRSVLMLACLYVGKYIFRRAILLKMALLWAVLLSLAARIEWLSDLGWQLSVGAMVALLFLQPQLSGGWTRLGSFLSSLHRHTYSPNSSVTGIVRILKGIGTQALHLASLSLLANSAVMLLIGPLLLNRVGTLSVGSLAGATLLWGVFPLVISTLFIGVILGCVLRIIPLLSVFLPYFSVIVVSMPLIVLERVLRWGNVLEWTMITGQLSVGWVMGWWVGLAACWLAWWRRVRRRQISLLTARWRPLRGRR